MRVLSIVHQRDAGAGVFAEAARSLGGELVDWYAAEAARPPADPLGFDAVMVFGGAMHADEDALHPWLAPETQLLARVLAARVPLLGVCLGAQLLSVAAGGRAVRAAEPEIGWFDVAITEQGESDPVIGPLAPAFEAFEWHSYECLLPADAIVLARSSRCTQAFRLGDLAWGIQFHAEVSRGDAAKWVREYDVDEDAVRVGVDPDVLGPATEQRIERWNDLGRGLCERFLRAARSRSTAPSRRP